MGRHFLEVVTGAKRRPVGSEHDDSHFGIITGRNDRRGDSRHQFLIQAVALIWPVEDQRQNAIGNFVTTALEYG